MQNKERILSFLKNNGPSLLQEISDDLLLPTATTSDNLKKLVKEGLVWKRKGFSEMSGGHHPFVYGAKAS